MLKDRPPLMCPLVTVEAEAEDRAGAEDQVEAEGADKNSRGPPDVHPVSLIQFLKGAVPVDPADLVVPVDLGVAPLTCPMLFLSRFLLWF